MARISTKIGDVFWVKVDETNKKFFQYIANDLTQLNSDVIRAFKKLYLLSAQPELTEIFSGEVDFYAHCVIKFGVKMGLWEKAGNINDVGDLSQILFRDTNDVGSRPGEQILVSEKWYVWRINDDDFTVVGKLKGENRKAEIGIVVNPYDIKNRMTTGRYTFFYPGYEYKP